MSIVRREALCVAEAIIEDIEGRKGLGDEWDAIDEDIQAEIKQEWVNLILGVINGH